MGEAERLLTEADLLPMADYASRRAELRRQLTQIRKLRRVEVGPFVTLSFECYQTMWFQVHEMLHAEKGGPAQVPEELAAYNPLIPQGSELVATMMIEIDDPARRNRILATLGHIEETVSLRFGRETVTGIPEQDTERTNEAGRTASVHFLHFPFTPAQIAAFRQPGTEVVVAVSHPQYRHMAVLPEAVREEVAKDFA